MPLDRISSSWSRSSLGRGDGLAGHAAQLSGREHPLLVLGQEGEHGLAEGAGVDGDDDADLRHLPAAVGAGLVVDDHDVVDEEHAGAHGQPGAAGEVLGPGDRPRPQLEGVEVDVAEPEDGGPELVAARPALLHDHPVLDQAADDAVRGRGREVEAGGQLGQAHPAGALERGQDPDRPVNRLDHGRSPLRSVTEFHENSCVLVNHRRSVQITFDNIESHSDQSREEERACLTRPICSSAWVLRPSGRRFWCSSGWGRSPPL